MGATASNHEYFAPNMEECLSNLSAAMRADQNSFSDTTVLCSHLSVALHNLALSDHIEFINNVITFLRNISAKGHETQMLIHNKFSELIKTPKVLVYLSASDEDITTSEEKLMVTRLWQLIANTCVMNRENQVWVWMTLKDQLVYAIVHRSNEICNIALMITYNVFLGFGEDCEKQDYQHILHILLRRLHLDTVSNNTTADYLCIFLEYFLRDFNIIDELFDTLIEEDQCTLLNYIIYEIKKPGSEKQIRLCLIEKLIHEFKRKTDLVLNYDGNNVNVRIVKFLLEIICLASWNDQYRPTLMKDRSLFLNLGCLLSATHKIGKQSVNDFTPVANISHLALDSEHSHEIQSAPTFEFKKLLLRTLANLAHQNNANQNLSRELEIFSTILECTTFDARNPLIKEDAILAIKYLCENNEENQRFIASLTRKGDSYYSDVLSEIDSGLGTLSIS